MINMAVVAYRANRISVQAAENEMGKGGLGGPPAIKALPVIVSQYIHPITIIIVRTRAIMAASTANPAADTSHVPVIHVMARVDVEEASEIHTAAAVIKMLNMIVLARQAK